MPETGMIFPPVSPRSFETEVNIFPTKETDAKARIHELSRMLFAESKAKKEADEKLQEKATRPDGFEPFINGEENGDSNLFVNLYGGNFSQKMELNRKGVEKALKIARLDGQVFLTSLSPNRQRAIEANPDGSVSAKRFLLFGKKIEENQENNPLSQVVAVPQGWRIEVNDTRITQELTEKKIGDDKLQRAFIRRFNRAFKEGLFECVWREKMSSEKNKHFNETVFFSLLPILIYAGVYFFVKGPSLPVAVGAVILTYGIYNSLGKLTTKGIRDLENVLKEDDPSFSPGRSSFLRQNFDSFSEYFMPLVEVDKVIETFVYLESKGRTLVRQTREEK